MTAMPLPPDSMERKERSLGLDRLSPQADGSMVVFSSEPKDERWRVRRFRKTLVMIEERGYFIHEIRDGEKDGCELVYHLTPWPADTKDIPGDTVVYDQAYLEERRAETQTRRQAGLMTWMLMLLSPLTGLVWERTKRRWHERWDAPPAPMTFVSVLLEFLAGLFWIVTSIIFIFVQGYGGMVAGNSLPGDVVNLPGTFARFGLGWILFIDAYLRYNFLNRYQPRYWGFYEWLFRVSPVVSSGHAAGNSAPAPLKQNRPPENDGPPEPDKPSP
jgi:hypothetical protein